MKLKNFLRAKDGKIGYAIFWLLGVPIPVLLVFFVMRGCN